MKLFALGLIFFSFFAQPCVAFIVNTGIDDHISQEHPTKDHTNKHHSHEHRHGDRQNDHQHSHKHNSLVQIEIQNCSHDSSYIHQSDLPNKLNNTYICQYISNPQPNNIFRPPIIS